jgi:hypothetical protein
VSAIQLLSYLLQALKRQIGGCAEITLGALAGQVVGIPIASGAGSLLIMDIDAASTTLEHKGGVCSKP